MPETNIMGLPNLLTMLRMGAVPILVVLFYLDGQVSPWLAPALFFVAGLTDLADGWLARRMKKVSVMGQYLDPLADKLMVGSVMIMLTALGRIPAWISVVIICREIAVTGLRAAAASQGFAVPSDRWGKTKTALQMLALLLLILPVAGAMAWGMGVLWAALIITVASGASYFARFVRRLKQVG